MPIKAAKKDGYSQRAAVKVLAVDPSGNTCSVRKDDLPGLLATGWHMPAEAAEQKPHKPAK